MENKKVEKFKLQEKVVSVKAPKNITKQQMLNLIEKIFGQKNIVTLQELYVCAEDQAEAIVICKDSQLITA